MSSFTFTRLGKIGLIGVIYAVLAQLIHGIFAFFSMSFYQMEEYLPVWSKIMMPSEAGPPPNTFFVVAFFFSFITGVLLAWAYSIIYKAFTGSVFERGICFGIVVFLISGIPGSLALFLLVNLPVQLIWIWAVEGFIINLIGGMIIGRLYSPK